MIRPASLLGGDEPRARTRRGKGRKKRSGPTAHADDNARVVLTGAPPAGCVETQDPHDRAHLARDGLGMLIPAAVERATRPDPSVPSRARMYHPSQIVVLVARRGAVVVGIDSAFDAAAERASRLEAQGVPMGWLGSTSRITEEALARASRRTRVRLTAAERSLSRLADAILAGGSA